MLEKQGKYKTKINNLWRKNQDLITYIGLAAILGLLIAGLNTWNHQNTINKYELTEPQPISLGEPAEFSFNISNPALTASTSINLVFNNTDDLQGNEELSISVNGQQIDSTSSNSITVSPDSDILETTNTVTISKTGAFSTQNLVSASVTSFTRLQQLTFIVLNFSALLLIFLPLGYVKYQQFRKRKKMEQEFPSFLRDVVEGTRAGMSLPKAIQNIESGNYSALDEKIEKMSAQIEWGVPFQDVLQSFGRDTQSDVIKRSSDTIIQAYDSGGDIQEVLESVGDNIRSIRRLKEERQSQLYGEMITGYIVYYIFIGILVALTTYLLPNLAAASESLGSGGLSIIGSSGGSTLQENITLYKQWFTRLVYIQAIFSGMIIGKLSEGKFSAGFKHTAILFASGYLAATFFL